ncbi:MAG: 30S ribosomal protein S3 [Spirochaetales bacterium]|nr:30S ribosomal protein S3 [Spirochaetales bacterium]
MGQKVNPIGMRLGINRTWRSKWYVDPREYADTLHEDLKLRKLISTMPETANAEISEVEIIRQPQRITIVIHTSRPGIIIGSKGVTIEKIGDFLQKQVASKVQLKIKEVKKPEVDAQIVSMSIARQLKSRASFRRTLKMSLNNAMRNGAQGIKVVISGRLGGAEMSRTESVRAGRVPLHTLRAHIDYGFSEANTTFGVIGVKVWVFKGEVLKKEIKEDAGAVVKKKRERVETRG